MNKRATNSVSFCQSMGLEGLEATGLFSVVSGRGKGQKGSEREQKK